MKLQIKEETISKVLRESIEKVIEEEKQPLLEFATFGVEKWGKLTYKIAVHGASTADRETPHIHIYLNNDVQPYSQFNFEVSLIDILCRGEANLIFQHDRANNIHVTNRTDCFWTGYKEIHDGFLNFLRQTPKPSRFGSFKDNLEKGIFEWSRETDYVQTINNGINMLRVYFQEHNLTPLPEFQSYLKNFNEE